MSFEQLRGPIDGIEFLQPLTPTIETSKLTPNNVDTQLLRILQEENLPAEDSIPLSRILHNIPDGTLDKKLMYILYTGFYCDVMETFPEIPPAPNQQVIERYNEPIEYITQPILRSVAKPILDQTLDETRDEIRNMLTNSNNSGNLFFKLVTLLEKFINTEDFGNMSFKDKEKQIQKAIAHHAVERVDSAGSFLPRYLTILYQTWTDQSTPQPTDEELAQYKNSVELPEYIIEKKEEYIQRQAEGQYRKDYLQQPSIEEYYQLIINSQSMILYLSLNDLYFMNILSRYYSPNACEKIINKAGRPIIQFKQAVLQDVITEYTAHRLDPEIIEKYGDTVLTCPATAAKLNQMIIKRFAKNFRATVNAINERNTA